MSLLPSLEGALPIVIGAVALAAVVLVVALVALVRKARQEAELVDTEPSTAADDVAVLDLRSAAPGWALRRSFARALRQLTRVFPGPRPRYQVPWFLTAGASQGGKTTALGHAGLSLPYGEPSVEPGEPPSGCSWWIFDRAVVLDVLGDFVLRADGRSSDETAWRSLLRLIRRSRARRPLDGVLLVVPASELLGYDPANASAKQRIADRGVVLHRKLWQAQKQLGMKLPVDLLVTKTDLVAGFGGFAAAVPAGERQQIFGWSNPNPVDTVFSSGWIDDAFASLSAGLTAFQLTSFGGGGEVGAAGDLYLFPGQLEALKEPLRIVASQIFAATSLHEPFPLRGLFFSGGEGWSGGGGPWQVDFLTDLLSHKMFYEWNLAVPTEKAAKARRRGLGLIGAGLAALLLAGTLGMWWGSRRVAEDAAKLAPLLQRAETSLKAVPAQDPDPAAMEAESRALVTAAATVPDYRLRSFFLPASWLAGADTLAALTGTWERVVFPALHGFLAGRLDTLATGPFPPPAASSAQLLALTDTGGYADLDAYLTDLGTQQTDLARYACLETKCSWVDSRLVDDYLALASDVYGQPATLPSSRARGFFGDLLRRAKLPATPDGEHDEAIRKRADGDGLSGTMYEQLYGGNVLVVDLDQMAVQIDALGSTVPTGSAATAAYRALVATIETTKKDLARPEVQWAGAKSFDLGAKYDALLAAVAASRFLGAETSRQMRAQGETGFHDLQKKLAGYQTAYTGALLAQNPDGSAQLTLSPVVQQLEAALQALLGEGFMQTTGAPALKFVPDPGTRLAWDTGKLTSAAALPASYQSFVDKSLALFPAALQATAQQAALANLEVSMLAEIRAAQQFPAAVEGTTPKQSEQALAVQVENLQAASGSLTSLLGSFSSLGLKNGYNQLAFVVESQKLALLTALDSLLAAESLYLPVGGGFTWWDGTPVLAYDAFGVTDAPGLQGYLDGQRQVVTRLRQQYADPVLALQTQNTWGFESRPVFVKWQMIQADLDDYKNKKAGNALSLLEGFITPTMVGLTLDNCTAGVAGADQCVTDLTPEGLRTGPCDEFLDTLNGLRRGVRDRCSALVEEEAYQGYLKIEASFDSRLLAKYPFAALAATSQAEATPADLRAFFAVYDQWQGLIAQVPDGSVKFGSALPAVRDFMSQMAAVRSVYSVFLADTTPGALPTWDFTASFRVNRDSPVESGSNQIMTWSFTSGPATVSLGDASTAGKWTYGTPAVLTLRWATSSLEVPTGTLDDPRGRIDGRTVTFTYSGAWSLVALMQEHRALSQDFPDYVDPDPSTLKLTVPVSDASSQPPQAQKDAVVFVRIQLTQPDEKKTAVTLPATFPASAPAVGTAGTVPASATPSTSSPAASSSAPAAATPDASAPATPPASEEKPPAQEASPPPEKPSAPAGRGT